MHAFVCASVFVCECVCECVCVCVNGCICGLKLMSTEKANKPYLLSTVG